MKNARLLDRDIHLLSSYLGRWTTVLVFGLVIAIAAGALFFEGIDIAHTRITIGVAAFDSTVASVPLRALADLVRERGCGDIRWRWLGLHELSEDCDFFLLTSVQAARPTAAGRLDPVLLALAGPGKRCDTGAVVRQPDRVGTPVRRMIYPSPVSTAGYLTPRELLGDTAAESRFAAERGGEARAALAVLSGAFDAGGIGVERLRALESTGLVEPGELSTVRIGDCLPEIVVAAGKETDPRIVMELVDRLPALTERMSPSLVGHLAQLGIAGFVAARDDDRAAVAAIADRLPATPE